MLQEFLPKALALLPLGMTLGSFTLPLGELMPFLSGSGSDFQHYTGEMPWQPPGSPSSAWQEVVMVEMCISMLL